MPALCPSDLDSVEPEWLETSKKARQSEREWEHERERVCERARERES